MKGAFANLALEYLARLRSLRRPGIAMPSAPKTNGRDLEGLPRVGDVVAGKYEVERILGVGGMGIVVAARHKQLDELVAIKLLHPDSAMDGEAVTRLMREARATISIKSEHVVRIIDVGTLDSGSPYILMEFLKGNDTIRDVIWNDAHTVVVNLSPAIAIHTSTMGFA